MQFLWWRIKQERCEGNLTLNTPNGYNTKTYSAASRYQLQTQFDGNKPKCNKFSACWLKSKCWVGCQHICLWSCMRVLQDNSYKRNLDANKARCSKFEIFCILTITNNSPVSLMTSAGGVCVLLFLVYGALDLDLDLLLDLDLDFGLQHGLHRLPAIFISYFSGWCFKVHTDFFHRCRFITLY